MIDDAVNEPPKPPVSTGNLRGSGYVFTKKNQQINKPMKSDKSYKTPTKTVNSNLEMDVGFAVKYARRQHSEWERWPAYYSNKGQSKSCLLYTSPSPRDS